MARRAKDGAATSPAAYESGLASAADLLAAAELDRQLTAELLALPALERIAAAHDDPRFRRPTLVKLLALRTEAELFDPAADARPSAEVGAAVAAALAAAFPRARQGKARQAAALAYWLFGKAQLKASQPQLADHSFRAMEAYLPSGGPSEEAALARVGRAQVAADSRDLDGAVKDLLHASALYSRLEAAGPAAACQAELGLLLLDSGDLVDGEMSMQLALLLLDRAFAPSLAARLHLGTAEVEATLGDLAMAREQLRRAQALYPLAPSVTEAIARRWREARIAAAAGEPARAEALLATVGSELLERGSLAEAARCTGEQVLLRIEARRCGAVAELTAGLAGAFPGAGERWAVEMDGLARRAAEHPESCYAAGLDLKRRLRQLEAVACPGRPPLLAPTRLLTDRLLRGRGEREDPVGAAAGL